MWDFVITVIFAIVFGVAKAMRDTIDFHWERSVLRLIENKKLMQWLRSDWENKPKNVFWFLWDGWHFFDTLTYLVPAIYAALWVYCGNNWFQALIFVLWSIVTFNYFFHVVLLADK